jgi:hypothetical protein
VKECIRQLLHKSFVLPTEAGIRKEGQGPADNEEISQTHQREALELSQPLSHQNLLREAAFLQGTPRKVVVNFIASDLLLRRQFRKQGHEIAQAQAAEGAGPEYNRYVALSMVEQDRYMAAFRLKFETLTAQEGRAPSDEEIETIELFARTAAVHPRSQ